MLERKLLFSVTKNDCECTKVKSRILVYDLDDFRIECSEGRINA
jgi:hypothetical protein